jgi:dihydrofolate synthase/folylpolyglutamate synthase
MQIRSHQCFQLDKIEQLLSQLGNPHLAYKVVHVAGTKGRDQRVQCISGLQAADLMSDYILTAFNSFYERIQINGK